MKLGVACTTRHLSAVASRLRSTEFLSRWCPTSSCTGGRWTTLCARLAPRTTARIAASSGARYCPSYSAAWAHRRWPGCPHVRTASAYQSFLSCGDWGASTFGRACPCKNFSMASLQKCALLQALDRGAVFTKADRIVTGHNADDIAETVLLNVLRGDIPRCHAIRRLALVAASPTGCP